MKLVGCRGYACGRLTRRLRWSYGLVQIRSSAWLSHELLATKELGFMHSGSGLMVGWSGS